MPVCEPTAPTGPLNATVYGAMAKRLVSGAVPANTVTYIRNAQQASGGWDFGGSADDGDGYRLDGGRDPGAGRGGCAGDGRRPAGRPRVPREHPSARNRRVAIVRWRRSRTRRRPRSLAITAAGFDLNVPCWRNTVAPGLSGQPYTSPLAWLRSQQNPTDHHINSHFDGAIPNTFATTQTIEALRRGWIPVTPLFPQSCP